MPSSYPAALDALTDPAGSAQMNDPALLHSVVEKNQNDAIEAIQGALGLNPQGGSATLAARLAALDTLVGSKANSSLLAQPSGIATLDSGSRLAQNVDASRIDAGTLAAARIPSLPATQIGSGTVALARLPLLPASQISSGTFDPARIPGLDGSILTSGTIPAARIPSSVTSNANAQVVADQPGRDTIPTASRVDGMLVLQRSPQVLWQWRADNSTWIQVGGVPQGAEATLEAYDSTTLTTSITTFDPGAPGLSQVFTAPMSGKVLITVSSLIIITTGTGAGYFGAEVRAGTTIGSGTIMDSVATQKCVATGGTAGGRNAQSMTYQVTGLTPGSSYHVRTMFTTSSSPTATMQLFYRRVLVEPVR